MAIECKETEEKKHFDEVVVERRRRDRLMPWLRIEYRQKHMESFEYGDTKEEYVQWLMGEVNKAWFRADRTYIRLGYGSRWCSPTLEEVLVETEWMREMWFERV